MVHRLANLLQCQPLHRLVPQVLNHRAILQRSLHHYHLRSLLVYRHQCQAEIQVDNHPLFHQVNLLLRRVVSQVASRQDSLRRVLPVDLLVNHPLPPVVSQPSNLVLNHRVSHHVDQAGSQVRDPLGSHQAFPLANHLLCPPHNPLLLPVLPRHVNRQASHQATHQIVHQHSLALFLLVILVVLPLHNLRRDRPPSHLPPRHHSRHLFRRVSLPVSRLRNQAPGLLFSQQFNLLVNHRQSPLPCQVVNPLRFLPHNQHVLLLLSRLVNHRVFLLHSPQLSHHRIQARNLADLPLVSLQDNLHPFLLQSPVASHPLSLLHCRVLFLVDNHPVDQPDNQAPRLHVLQVLSPQVNRLRTHLECPADNPHRLRHHFRLPSRLHNQAANLHLALLHCRLRSPVPNRLTSHLVFLLQAQPHSQVLYQVIPRRVNHQVLLLPSLLPFLVQFLRHCRVVNHPPSPVLCHRQFQQKNHQLNHQVFQVRFRLCNQVRNLVAVHHLCQVLNHHHSQALFLLLSRQDFLLPNQPVFLPRFHPANLLAPRQRSQQIAQLRSHHVNHQQYQQ